ncbi:MAG TPA: hypothetical protein VEA80_17285 [Vitreimonas sp.]|uniref:hypothetical protein n=1 Tax=Vitreimonas sp. TaxID=3069702 RepID=UPI002D457E49|nr:hypothetical protein [Vitreimonas sp.]HYD89236.1 hypothetical protein [Vitreimonas sp.]
MSKLILQVQLLLAALSALLPLVPEEHRSRAAELLDLAARALAFGGVVTTNLDDLALKLAAVRADVEAMAAAGRAVSAEEMDAALARVRAASAGFREALAERGAG